MPPSFPHISSVESAASTCSLMVIVPSPSPCCARCSPVPPLLHGRPLGCHQCAVIHFLKVCAVGLARWVTPPCLFVVPATSLPCRCFSTASQDAPCTLTVRLGEAQTLVSFTSPVSQYNVFDGHVRTALGRVLSGAGGGGRSQQGSGGWHFLHRFPSDSAPRQAHAQNPPCSRVRHPRSPSLLLYRMLHAMAVGLRLGRRAQFLLRSS